MGVESTFTFSECEISSSLTMNIGAGGYTTQDSGKTILSLILLFSLVNQQI
jgi:hypothetical protein